MSELVYVHPNSSLKPKSFTNIINGVTSERTSHILVLNEVIEGEKPVTVIDDEIEIDDNLMDENVIYPIKYKDEQYYVRRVKGAVEIFKLDE